ncbi:T6SS phospholipase effector Tle1-like catalytic domain-containing protein [Xanthomonas oryzae pv. oryzicola]|uniref:T6SS phospholipase effector Tle1-like catalytic domain-containing protein n=1 Tax=Xanthomonas oryzae TaxID=347 RepID=UPI000A3F6194|nr:DUF2235 domain-containing protein [Xanthomonas oryzae]
MTSYPTGALPMPPDGQRRLTPAEAQRRAQAMACLRDKNSECQGQVHVNLFFDGTGNNWKWEGTFIEGKKRSTQTQRARDGHSNVARLYEARLDEPDNGFFNHYMPGVGTPFPEVGDTSTEGSALGGAAALYGAHRINWAIIQVYNSINRYLTGANLIENDEAKLIVSQMSQISLAEGFMRRTYLEVYGRKLEQLVKTHQRKIKSLNIAVFGFSRGAAAARAFVHWLYEVVEPWGSGCGYNLAGVPMQLTFLGIFDTVASVGMAAMSRVSEGKMAWAHGEMMSIHPEVKQCVHFAALHEQRINFPADLAASGKEVLYPGMHSDVGGGYSPGGQGKDFVDAQALGAAKLSQIPLIDMHHEAIKAGVPLMTMEEIRQRPALAKYFGCHTQLIDAYNGWLAGHAIAGGDHMQQIRQHCRQYVQWKGMRLWEGPDSLLQQPFYVRADAEDKVDLAKAQHAFGQLVADMSRQNDAVDGYQQAFADYKARDQAWQTSRQGPRPVPPRRIVSADLADAGTKELLDVVLSKKPVPPVVANLFDNYVHDSLAGFYIKRWTELDIPVAATNGYLRYRSVFKLTSSWQQRECVDTLTTPMPPANVPSIDQAFGMMGNAMR